MKKEEAFHRVGEGGNIVHKIKRRNANWIGYRLRGKCLVKHIIEGKVDGGI